MYNLYNYTNPIYTLFLQFISVMALRRMLVLNKSARCARRDKHTPCIKTNRLKRQNRSRAERGVRAKPLGEPRPFFSHIGNAIFCPLFHRRIFSFLYQSAKFAFVFSARTPHLPLIHNTFSSIKNIFLPRKLPFDPFTLFNGHVLRCR